MNAQRPIVAVVGAGGSIGGAVAAMMSPRHRLALLGLDTDALAAVARDLPDDTLVLPVDASSTAQMERAFATIAERGELAALAVAVGTTTGGSLHEIDAHEWEAVITSNLTTVFQSLRVGIRHMMRGGGGSICVIGSVHADTPQPGFPAYAAAKAGVAALVAQAAAEYGQHGIRVNLVTPGWTLAPHTVGRLEAGDERRLLDSTPLRALVEPVDIAESVVWLLSDAARRITGADMVVDGGARLLSGGAVLRSASRSRLGLSGSTGDV